MELEADKQAYKWLIEVLRNDNYDEIITFFKKHFITNKVYEKKIFDYSNIFLILKKLF